MSTTKSKAAKKAPKANAAEDLRALFEDMLKDIYWAEKALTKALPKMIKNATSEQLVNALNDHLDVTKEQVARLEEVFGLIGKKPQAKKCDAMEGLLKEGEGIIEATEPGAVRDAGIIAAGQKVEHYEIASYGTLVAWANIIGEEEAADLLQLTLDEEKEADSTLTNVAENDINFVAAEGDEEAPMASSNGKSKTGKKATSPKSALIHE